MELLLVALRVASYAIVLTVAARYRNLKVGLIGLAGVGRYAVVALDWPGEDVLAAIVVAGLCSVLVDYARICHRARALTPCP